LNDEFEEESPVGKDELAPNVIPPDTGPNVGGCCCGALEAKGFEELVFEVCDGRFAPSRPRGVAILK
jgi:hypothetical protein